jgi:hypothetical protein
MVTIAWLCKIIGLALAVFLGLGVLAVAVMFPPSEWP